MFQKTISFTKTIPLKVDAGKAVRIDLDQELYSIPDFSTHLALHKSVQVRAVKTTITPNKTEFSTNYVIYGICFSNDDVQTMESLEQQKLKFQRKNYEEICFNFETFSKRVDKTQQVVLEKDLFIGINYKPLDCYVHLEYICVMI